MIKTIQIENIKGIGNKKFELNILPNRPSLLVAPNGFGKSSIATAFNSMNNNRIDLQEDDYHKADSSLLPRIFIEYEKIDCSVVQLEATSTKNTIKNELAYFVINNQTRAKGIGSQYGRASATLQIEDVVLCERVPDNVSFSYQYSTMKLQFGVNSKVLPNAATTLKNLKLVEKLSNNYISLEKANGVRIQSKINAIIKDINDQVGTSEELVDWVKNNKLEDLKQIEHLNTIGNIIHSFDTELNSEVKSYLIALQLLWLYKTDPNEFKNACKYSIYLLFKERFAITISNFNCTWKDIKAQQSRGKLVVKFPKAMHISNGQRDILTFIAMLFRAKSRLTKESNILIIDEIFDYLDDANLITAQYYVTTFIKEFKDEGKSLYPIILTHINPNYFKNYAFKSQKVYYLDKSNIKINENLAKLLREKAKDDSIIKDSVDKYLLHYDPECINKRDVFKQLNL